MFSTCLTDKFSKELVADTLTINSAIANRETLKLRKDYQKEKKEKVEILPPLHLQQKSIRLEKYDELFTQLPKKKLSL